MLPNPAQSPLGDATLRFLADVSAALSRSLGLEQLLATIGELVVPALGDFCMLDVIEGGDLRPAGERHIDPGKQVLVAQLHRALLDKDLPQPQAQVLRSREPLLVPEAMQSFMRAGGDDAEHLRLVQALAPHSLMVLPLIAHGRSMGVLTLVRTTSDGRYGAAELALAEEIASRTAMALDNARLHRDLQAAMQFQNEQDRYLRTIFRQIPGMIWATDRSLRFTYVAGNLPSVPDLAAKKLIGSTVYDFLGSRDPTEPGVAHHFAALAGQPQSFQYRCRDRWYTVLVEPLRDQDRKIVGCIGASFDVTELTEATQKHERALSLLQTTLEATADGILVVDRTGKVMLVNERLRSLWQLSAVHGESLEEETVLEHMLAQVEDPDGFRAATLELQARPEGELVDVLRLKDGRVFERHSRPQRVGEAIVGRVWCYRDISEHDRLLRRALCLADATRLLASLDVERALEAVARLIVPYAGDSCAIDLFGEGEPRRRLALLPTTKHPFAQEPHPLVRAGQAQIYRVDSISYLGVPFVAKGIVLGAMTLAAPPPRTYTQADLEFAEQLGRRAALAIENARLYQSAQEALQARDEFLSIAAHEIRGPITSLHLSVQVLNRGKVPKEEQAKIFAIIEREDRRLLQFVDELLDVSRIRAGAFAFDFQEVDLGELVRNVTDRMSPDVARAGSSLTINVEGQVRGEWDEFRLEQVVTNLLSNAIKFGLGKPIVISVSARDGRAIIAVKDQGIGIVSERQGRIWRPFERGVPVRHYGGLGLGLYIVKTIAEGMGGCVSVESAPGAGSTFTVELPQVKAGSSSP